MSVVYWGIVTAVLAMVVLLFVCVSILGESRRYADQDDGATAPEEAAAQSATSGSRHAA